MKQVQRASWIPLPTKSKTCTLFCTCFSEDFQGLKTSNITMGPMRWAPILSSLVITTYSPQPITSALLPRSARSHRTTATLNVKLTNAQYRASSRAAALTYTLQKYG